MNEVTKARFILLGVAILFIGGLFGIGYGAAALYKYLTREDDSPKIIGNTAPDQQQKTKKIIIEPDYVKVQKKIKALDRSNTLYGLLPAWKKYHSPDTGILVDVTNNKVLWSYHADKKVPIASMSKMLTVWIALDQMKVLKDKIDLSSNVTVSFNSATAKEGTFGFNPGDNYSIEDLMKAAVVRSANDAAGALAVYFGGTEDDFIRMMNENADKLGMKNSHFINPHGLPEGKNDNISTMNDLLILCMLLIKDPDYMRWAKIKGTKIGNRLIVNTNNLMRRRKYPGVDGLKTGYTRRAGFCLAFSCKRDGRRIVGAVGGFPSARDRENFLTALLNWAYNK